MATKERLHYRQRLPTYYTKAETPLRESIAFLKEFARHPTKVGAIAPSSRRLVTMMVDSVDWDAARNVVELGPGTGVFTTAIADRLHADATFFAIERSPEMAAMTRQRCPAADVAEDSATNLDALCHSRSIEQIDAVICGLPWASFPDQLQRDIMSSLIARMKDDATFATFAYWQGVVLPAGRSFASRLHENFSRVERSPTVWRNLPPAFVYRCRK